MYTYNAFKNPELWWTYVYTYVYIYTHIYSVQIYLHKTRAHTHVYSHVLYRYMHMYDHIYIYTYCKCICVGIHMIIHIWCHKTPPCTYRTMHISTPKALGCGLVGVEAADVVDRALLPGLFRAAGHVNPDFFKQKLVDDGWWIHSLGVHLQNLRLSSSAKVVPPKSIRFWAVKGCATQTTGTRLQQKDVIENKRQTHAETNQSKLARTSSW